MTTFGDELLGVVNKLQDLVYNSIGLSDGLDLPQIVCSEAGTWPWDTKADVDIGGSRVTVQWKELGPREHRMLPSQCKGQVQALC